MIISLSLSQNSRATGDITRRYKHYDWFHERLVNKFTFLSVPPLPDKQFYGNKSTAVHAYLSVCESIICCVCA